MVLTNTLSMEAIFMGGVGIWIRRDYMVTCWILNSMVTELFDAFLYAQSCTYDVLEKFMLRDRNSKLIQFLMKLNDEYESVRSQILAMDPLPTVNKAYYIVQQIEIQKKVTNHTFEPSAFFANMNNKGSNNWRKENRGSTNDGKRFCTGRNQEGHTVDKCFEKIGYPDCSDTPFDLCNENEIEMYQRDGFDQKLVVVVCQEVMKMFKGKGGESNASREYTVTYLKNPIIIHLPVGSSKIVTIVGKVQLTPSLDPSTNQVVAVGKGSRCLYICKPTIDPIAFFTSIFEFRVSHLNSFPTTSLSEESFSNSVSKNGPYKQAALNGAHYFFTIVDDDTRVTWTYLVHSKEQIPSLLVSFFAYVKTHFQRQPKVVRSDNGTEIVNKTCAEFFQTHGVVHQKSMAYTPKQNGRDANVKPHKDKFKNKGVKCVLIGYHVNQKGYKFYNWETNEIFLSSDVVFEEHVFPFKQPDSPSDEHLCPIYPVFETRPLEETVILNTPLPETTPTVNLVFTKPAVKHVAEPNQSDQMPFTSTSVPVKKSTRSTTRPAWL
ncbi:retrovirus-related pol polyprotein from transposon TNT 1-94 [Tanacetum coccineum]